MTQPENPKPLAALEAEIAIGYAVSKEMANKAAGWTFTPYEILRAETAFLAYREQVASIERENALLRAFVEKLSKHEINPDHEPSAESVFLITFRREATALLSRVAGNEEASG